MKPTSHPHAVLAWPAPRPFLWLWIVLVVGTAWWSVFERLAPGDRFAPGLPQSVAIGAAVLVSRFLGSALEAGYYTGLWRAVGRRMPFVWLFSWITALSLLDVVAAHARRWAEGNAALAPWLAPLAGVGVLGGDAGWGSSGVVLGDVGLLALARVACTGTAQARALGIGIARPLALTLATWLAILIVRWWAMDLARGTSPLS